MKLKQNFETLELDDNVIAVPIGDGSWSKAFHGVIKLNETAAIIFELLQKGTAEEQIVDVLAQKYDVPREILTNDVTKCLESFRENGILI